MIILLSNAPARATPRLAAQYGQNCQLCHVNPTGGGMRNAYVSQFIAPQELAFRPLPAHDSTLWPKPRINDQISIGTDLRLLYLATNKSGTTRGQIDNTFFEMQGDVYLAIEPDSQFLIYLDRGLYSDFEAFALARILPAHGYLKAGKFVPDLGWRWDDHNRLTREKLGLDFPGASDAGIEIGLNPGPFVVSGGVFNGSRGSQLDDNRQKAVVGRFLYRRRIGPVEAAFGGSGRVNYSTFYRERLIGAQAQAVWGPFAYIGDYYFQRTEPLVPSAYRTISDSVKGLTWAWLFSQELDFQPHRGVDFYLGYDFRDPDIDYASGSHYQISLGARVYVRHFLKIEPIWRLEEDDTEPIPGRSNNNRFEVLLHAFY